MEGQILIFDCREACAVAEVRELDAAEPVLLGGEGLWVGVLVRGRCVLQSEGGPEAAGDAGDALAGSGPLTLRLLSGAHFLAARLTGLVPQAFLHGLGAPRLLPADEVPGAAALLERLDPDLPAAENSRLAYELLCLLGAAGGAARALPPLVAEALAVMREQYMSLYGVEELSEQLMVSKCHLVRTFSAAMGVSPGRYLTRVRVEAVKRLLLEGEHDLETAAALCGFSGANYLCRVFRRETGLSPAVWRARALSAGTPAEPYAAVHQDEVYV